MKKIILLFLFANFIYAQECNDICGYSALTTSDYKAITSDALQTFNNRLTKPGVNSNTSYAVGGVTISAFRLAQISDGTQSANTFARYNELTNSFEIRNANGEILNVDTIKNLTISFADTKEAYKAMSYIDENGKEQTDFFMANKNGKLLKKVEYKYVKAKVAKTSYAQNKPAKLIEQTTYFYRSRDNRLLDLSLSKRKLAKQFPKYSDKILDFIKKNKTDFNKETDLLKFAGFLDAVEVDIYSDKSRLASANK